MIFVAIFRLTPVGHSCQPAKMRMETQLPLLSTYGYRVDLTFSSRFLRFSRPSLASSMRSLKRLKT
jgi:hypothetical protein